MQSLATALAEHEFFKGLRPSTIELIAGCGRNSRFEAGEYIFREGDAADVFYVIRHGSVALETFVPGRGPVVIQTLGEGEVLGWSWLIPPYRWRFDAHALELTRATVLDGTCLRGKCEDDYQTGYELVSRFAQVLVQRLEATRLQILDIYGQPRPN